MFMHDHHSFLALAFLSPLVPFQGSNQENSVTGLLHLLIMGNADYEEPWCSQDSPSIASL